MYLECFECGTEMRIEIEISEKDDPRLIICPVCESKDIEIIREDD